MLAATTPIRPGRLSSEEEADLGLSVTGDLSESEEEVAPLPGVYYSGFAFVPGGGGGCLLGGSPGGAGRLFDT